MLYLKHVGIYCKNLDEMEDFYKNVFDMKAVVSKQKQEDELIQDLLNYSSTENNNGSYIMTSKLITKKGFLSKDGDMIELLEIPNPANSLQKNIFDTGTAHICFGVDNIEETNKLISENGGQLITNIHIFPNGNKCCFARDIEGNFLELIQKGI